MVFGYLLGAGVGLVGGITAGVYALGYLPFLKAGESYKALNITADIDPAVPHKAAPDKISEAHRDLLKFTPPWTKWPDYHTVTWLNTIVRVVWPTYRKMLPDMVQEIAKAQLEAVYKQVPGGLLERLDIDIVDIGTKPLQFGGFRNFVTGDDEIIIEAPLLWGSDMKVRVTAHLKLGAFTVAIPAEVSNVQCRGQARITIKPLVETLPCVGAITVSLIDDPYVDANVSLLDSPDLLALPLVYDAMHLGVKMVAGQLMGYPNSMTFPIMPNSGLPPEPVGMLKVTVLRAKGLPSTLTDKIDPFVKLMVRENRPMKTSVVDNCNHPEWNETYDFVVDDAAAQCLTMLVYDEDLVKDNRVCEAEVPFKNAQFMRIPRRAVHMKVPLFKSRQLSIAEAAVAMDLRRVF